MLMTWNFNGVNPQGYSNGSLNGCPSWATARGGCSGKSNLQCDSYTTAGQCKSSYWWYSESQNSAYALNHDDSTSSTAILSNITENYWSTGQLLFENAAICNIRNMLGSLPGLTYMTSYRGNAGFTFQGNVPNDLSGDNYAQAVDSATNFIPINGAGLSHLSTISAYANLLMHPNTSSLFSFDSNGLDFSCVSQLNVRIANSWGPPWTTNSPSS